MGEDDLKELVCGKSIKKIISYVLILCIVFLVLPQNAYSVSFNFNPQSNVSNTAFGPATDEQLAVSGTNAYMIWTDQSAGPSSSPDIFFANNTNSGAFYSPIDISNNDGVSEFPQIAVANNHVYAVWQDDSTHGGSNDILFTNSTNGGHDFSKPFNFTTGIGDSSSVHLVAAGSKVYAVWKNLAATTDIYFINGTDSGSGVKFPDPIKNISVVQSTIPNNPQIAVSGNHVYVVWEEMDSSNVADILFSNSTDGGRTFSPPANLTKNSGNSQFPQIAVSGNNVYLVWQDNTVSGGGPNDILFLKGSDSGTSSGVHFLSPSINLSNSTSDDSLEAQISASGNNVYVVWREDTGAGANDEIYYSRSVDAGSSFNVSTSGAPINLSVNSGISDTPMISSSGTNVYVVWQDNTANVGGNDVFFKASSDSGNNFGGFNIVNTVSSIAYPTTPVIASSTSNAYVGWSSDNNGAPVSDIFFRAGTISTSGSDISFDKNQYRLSDTARLQIISPSSNTTAQDTINANVTSTSDPLPNGIFPTLTENSTTSANFTSTITFGASSSGTILKASPGDTITTYFGGQTGTAFIYPRTVNFDFSFYELRANATITVTDQNSNDPTIIDTIHNVNVNSTSDPVGLTFNIVESSVDSAGIFKKKIGFSNHTLGTTLKANVGDTIKVTFLGKSSTAEIGGTGPGGGGGGLIQPGQVIDALTGGAGYTPPNLLKIYQTLDPNKVINSIASVDINDLPFSLEGKGYPAVFYSNKVPTTIVQTNTDVPLGLTMYTPFEIEHLGLYFNIHGNTGELQDSDTYILYDKASQLKIIDPHGIFANVKLNYDKSSMKNHFSYDITFAKPMAKSDIIERYWDTYRHSFDRKIYDAIQVTGVETNNAPSIPIPQVVPKTVEQKSDLMGAIKEWGGFSAESISDEVMLKTIGIEGTHIPSWTMKMSKMVVDGQLDENQLVTVITYLHDIHAIK